MSTMKVRALRTVTAHGLGRGDVKEVPEHVARELLRRGWAEEAPRAKPTEERKSSSSDSA